MKTHSAASRQQRNVWHAAVKRTAPASLIYLILWSLVFVTGYLPPLSLGANVLLWMSFTLIPLGRVLLMYQFDLIYQRFHPVAWHVTFTLLAVVPAAAWSFITFMSLVQNTSLEINLALIFAVVGIVSGGVNTFSPVMYQVVIFLSVMLFPSAYAIGYRETGLPPVIAIYFLMYWVGMILVGRIQNKELKESIRASVTLERNSNLDPLTGLANRRHLFGLIDDIVQTSTGYPRAVLVVVDIDHFKSINDRFGHPVGDECLVRFAEVFQSAFDEEDVHCIRFGGEEFLALYLNADVQHVARQAEKLLVKVRRDRFQVAGVAISYTVSGGIAGGPIVKVGDFEQILDKADDFLYQAKDNGRDRIVV